MPFTDRILPMVKLDKNREHDFHYKPNADDMSEIIALNQWRKAHIERFSGQMTARPNGWILTGNIDAKITQNCVISAAPVQTEIHKKFERNYLQRRDSPGADQSIEIDIDDDSESLPQNLDLLDLLCETLLLELPDYPKLKKYQNDDAWEFDPRTEDEEKSKPFMQLGELLAKKNNESNSGS